MFVTVKLANVPTLVKLEPTTLLANVVPVNVFDAAVTVTLAVPSKLVPLIVRAFCNAVAVEALPLNAAVIVPALKLPLESRLTTAEAVFALVALDERTPVALS